MGSVYRRRRVYDPRKDPRSEGARRLEWLVRWYYLREQLRDVFKQAVEIFFDDAPRDAIVDTVVAMYKDVSVRTSSFIDGHPFLKYSPLEIRVPKPLDSQEINIAGKNILKLMQESEKSPCGRAVWLFELDQ